EEIRENNCFLPTTIVVQVLIEWTLNEATRSSTRGRAVLEAGAGGVREIDPIVSEVVQRNVQCCSIGQRGNPLNLENVEPGFLLLSRFRGLQKCIAAGTAAERLEFLANIRTRGQLIL